MLPGSDSPAGPRNGGVFPHCFPVILIDSRAIEPCATTRRTNSAIDRLNFLIKAVAGEFPSPTGKKAQRSTGFRHLATAGVERESNDALPIAATKAIVRYRSLAAIAPAGTGVANLFFSARKRDDTGMSTKAAIFGNSWDSAPAM